MATIALINPPNPPRGVSNKDTMGGLGQLYPAGANGFPPLDIPYTAAVLRGNGIPVQVIDCLGCELELGELILRLQEERPELVAIRTSTPTFEWDMRVVQIIKMVIGSPVIVFGPHVTLFPEQTLGQPSVDAAIVGEPEFAIRDIAVGGRFRGCKGVGYKENGKIVWNEPSGPIADLDSLPFPAWDLMPLHAYEGGRLMRFLKPFVTALTSRGCPYTCSYCPYPVMQGRKQRARSPDNVVDELEWLTKSLGVKAVLFRDPEFALRRERVVGICDNILKRGVRVAWRCETRMEDLDEELITLMGKAGCIGINMGIESGDPQVLKNVHRKAVPFAETKRIIEMCKRHEIDTFCFFVLGLPGEDQASALKTIDYAVRLGAAVTQFTVATPYPGTELRRWAEGRGYIEEGKLSAMTSYNPLMRNEHLTVEEIRWLQWYAHEAMAMRWRQVAGRMMGGGRQVASEVKRWLNFHVEKVTQRGLKRISGASGSAIAP